MATIFSFSQRKPKAPATPARQPRDWTNQELSDLYRAVASLGQAGISVEIDRGLTDEGDPWMVLCRLDGEVFIHFCRLDGQYLLDSPVLGRPLRGRDFAELVDLFIAQASRAAAPNVVAFRASRVLLHPAALLTVLVWSLYVWSSDTSEAQASEWSDLDEAGLPAHMLEQGGDTGDGVAAHPEAPAAAGKPALMVDGVPADRMASRLVQAVDHSAGWAGSNNVAAMQLLAVVSTLVLTTMSTQSLDGGSEPSGDALLPSLAALHLPEGADVPVAVDSNAAEAAGDAVVVSKAPVVPAQGEGALALDGQVAELHHPAVLLHPEHPEAPRDPVLVQASLAPALFVHDALSVDGADQITLPSAALPLHSAFPAGEFNTLLGSAVSLAHYEVNGLDLLASFNPADTFQLGGLGDDAGLIDLLLDAPEADVPEPPVQHGTYGEAARELLASFLAQAGDLQIVASATELVLIDLTAFDDTMDRAYAYSWSMEDGGTISAVGHFDFFAGYALV